MKTVIFIRDHWEIAITDNPIPVKPDGRIDYEEYIKRISPVKEIKRDITKLL